MARHPNSEQLSSWLNGGHEHLNDHIDSCEKCASRLDELDGSLGGSVTAITEDLRPALLTLLQPPEDLHERISVRIAARLQNRHDADLFASLVGVPIEASRIFFDSSSADDEDSSSPGDAT